MTAVVRDPARLSREVRAVTLDLAAPDPAILRTAVGGADAVLSALGQRRRSDAGIMSRGTRAIVEAMRAEEIRRIVVVSAAPISTVASPGRPHPARHDPGDGVFMRYLLSPLTKAGFRTLYADLAVMEDVRRSRDRGDRPPPGENPAGAGKRPATTRPRGLPGRGGRAPGNRRHRSRPPRSAPRRGRLRIERPCLRSSQVSVRAADGWVLTFLEAMPPEHSSRCVGSFIPLNPDSP